MVNGPSQASQLFVPDRGNLIWLSFDPQAGREQAGRRPGLVLSPVSYNRRTRLALVCPITSQVKGYPFEVPLPDGLPITGVVLTDHLRSLDWQERRADMIATVPPTVLNDVLDRLAPLLGYR